MPENATKSHRGMVVNLSPVSEPELAVVLVRRSCRLKTKSIMPRR